MLECFVRPRLRPLWFVIVGLGAALWWAGGCSSVAETPMTAPLPLAEESIFPHKANWGEPTQHGLFVKRALFSTAGCTACHGANLEGGSGPSCRSCHAEYPHGAEWAVGTEHGAAARQNEAAACTTTCHGTDLQGGLSGVGCTQCHATYPHAAGWAEPAVHGPFGEAARRAACTGCHGSDGDGGMSGVACAPCHQERYPHTTTWSDPAEHGAAALQDDAAACRTSCHGTALEGGLSRVSCTACHALWPHATGDAWRDTQHGETARTVGTAACLGCHKTDPPGGNTGVTCTSCHASLLAHDADDWAAQGHGTAAATADDMDPASGCALCHGADLAGGRDFADAAIAPAPGCASCHASYPQAHAAVDWATFAGHGSVVLADSVATNSEDARARCGLCHGADLTGGSVGVSCFTSACHAAYPHPPHVAGSDFAPWLARHGSYVRLLEAEAATLSCATARCHGTTLQGDPESAPVAEKRVPGCGDCHLTMPHPAAEAWDHGKSVVTSAGRLDVDVCRQCHGAALEGQGTIPSCTACHATYPDQHQASDWNTGAGHGALVVAAAVASGETVQASAVSACAVCHGAELHGGAAGVACDGCHRSFPHAPDDLLNMTTPTGVESISFLDDAWSAFTQGHGAYVVARAQSDARTIHQQVAVECATGCHGTDLQTPLRGTTCATCHGSAQFPHRFPEWIAVAEDTGTNHGEAVVAGAAAEAQSGAAFAAATCASSHCHGADAVAWGGGSCTTCHASYPTLHLDSAWGEGSHAALAQQSLEECQQCHGINTPGGAGVACTDCHDPQNVYPHAAPWAQSAAQSATGGLHGEAAVAGGGAASGGCLTACHGEHGNDGFLGASVSCTGCHTRYPHFAPWVLPAASGYAEHGKAVINIYDSLDRSDDSFNPTKFSECSGCHGAAVTFAASQFTLTNAQQYSTLPNGAQSPRCTACHRYPHLKTAAPAGTIIPWGDEWGHALTVRTWHEQQGGDMAAFAAQTCGSGGNGAAGCHTGWVKKKVGPWPAGKEALCGFCHLSVAL